MSLLERICPVLKSLNRIEELAARMALPQLVEAVEKERSALAPASAGRMRWVHRTWRAWILLHGAARRNPCLYATLLTFAYERKAGNDVRVNVAVSTDTKDSTDGHCWLSGGGKVLYPLTGPMPDEHWERIGEENRVIYWWRRSNTGEQAAADINGGTG